MFKKAFFALISATSILLAACGGGGNGTAAMAPPPPSSDAPVIAIQPSDQAVSAGQTATFTVTATGSAPLSYQWQRGASSIAGATATTYTTAVTTAGDSGSSFAVVVTDASGSTTSRSAALLVASGAVPAGTDVLTYKYDLSRSGQNPSESTLTPANVTSSGFGLLRNLPVDGKVDAQPLYISRLLVSGSQHNVVFAATEHDSVYAFDADTGSLLWQATLLEPGEALSDPRGCSQVTP